MKLVPAETDFDIAESVIFCGIDVNDHMQVIAHHRIGGDVDGENLR